MSPLDVPDPVLAWTLAGVTCGYLVFGITAFGASMVALPFLVQALPLTQAVPLMLLCDLLATHAGSSPRFSAGEVNAAWRRIARRTLTDVHGVSVEALCLEDPAGPIRLAAGPTRTKRLLHLLESLLR